MSKQAPPNDLPRWMVMFYFSGDNDLGPWMIQALNALKFHDIGTHNLAFTIYYAPYSPFFKPGYYKLPPADAPEDAVDVVQAIKSLLRDGAALSAQYPAQPLSYMQSRDGDAVRPGNEKSLTSFINWSIKQYPDFEHRMLILSGHGGGAVGAFLPAEHAASSKTHSGLTLLTLRSALADAKKESRKHLLSSGKLFDIIGMDTCLMGMAEVCDVAEPYADYLVASEGYVPEFGWPYDFLMHHFADPRVDPKGQYSPTAPVPLEGLVQTMMKTVSDPKEISRYFVNAFAFYYAAQAAAGVSVDIASCELSKPNVKGLKQSLEALSQALCKQLRKGAPNRDVIRDALIVAHWRAQSFNFELYTDLWDFCNELSELLQRDGGFPDIRDACDTVKNNIDTMVSDRQESVGPEFQYSHGLSIYFPWSSPGEAVLRNYEKLFANGKSNSPGWTAFLKSYFSATMREPREFPKNRLHAFKPGRAATSAQSDDSPRQGGLGNKHAAPYNKHAAPYNKNSPLYNQNSTLYNQMLSLMAPTLQSTMKNPQNRFSVPEELAGGPKRTARQK